MVFQESETIELKRMVNKDFAKVNCTPNPGQQEEGYFS